MDHDRLFKQLLRTFFTEFLELFLPDVGRYIEPGSVQFLDKEVFTDLTGGDRHEVDLLARCRFRGRDAYFLMHIETQASARGSFARRMFHYFARLDEAHDLPVYPIALLTYETPLRPEPQTYEIAFPDVQVLQFRYQAIQLNQMRWRDYMRRHNPVAAALMTRMQIAPEDRPQVKLEILRLLATLKLNPARQSLIRESMDSYLQLSAQELDVYNRGLDAITPPEKEALMKVLNEWEEIGEVRGKIALISAQLRRRMGDIPADVHDRMKRMDSDRLQSLGEAMLDFATLDDVRAWLDGNVP